MFFAKPGEYEKAGLYSIGHFILLSFTIVCVIIAVKYTKNKSKEQVIKIIRNITIFMWVLEMIKIVFNLAIGNAKNPNTYVPLYFCSLMLYAGIFSGFCKGVLKHIGDVFMATGGLVAGLVFLLIPYTSLSIYPLNHFISIQSFLLHGSMIYLGILVNVTGYVKIEKIDIIYYSSLIILISVIAYIVNINFDSNLMFISKDYPGTPIHWLYAISGKFFTISMILIQAIIPFYLVEGINRKIKVK